MSVVYYFVALAVIRNQMELCRSYATVMLLSQYYLHGTPSRNLISFHVYVTDPQVFEVSELVYFCPCAEPHATWNLWLLFVSRSLQAKSRYFRLRTAARIGKYVFPHAELNSTRESKDSVYELLLEESRVYQGLEGGPGLDVARCLLELLKLLSLQPFRVGHADIHRYKAPDEAPRDHWWSTLYRGDIFRKSLYKYLCTKQARDSVSGKPGTSLEGGGQVQRSIIDHVSSS
jgi:hypothetical protein